MNIGKLLPVENDAEAGNIFQSNESRPRLIVMASEEIASDLPVDAVVPKHAPLLCYLTY